MTIREIKKTLLDQLGNEKDAMNIYRQIQRSLKADKKPLKSIWWLKITRNDYLEGKTTEEGAVIHIEINDSLNETCL